MQYFILLSLFPPEIVQIIYKFVLTQKSTEKIFYAIKFHNMKNKILFNSVSHLIFNNLNLHNKMWCVYSEKNIYNLNFILNNNYSTKLLFANFWNYYLSLLSKRLYSMYTNFLLSNVHNLLDKKVKNIHNNIKKTIQLWFALCIKFNVKMHIGKKKYPNNISSRECVDEIIYARNIEPIKNFNNFVFPPCLVCKYDIPFDPHDSLHELDRWHDNYLAKYDLNNYS